MGAIAVVLGVLAAGLAVAAAWLLSARARLVGELSRAMADLDAGRTLVLERDRRIEELNAKNAGLGMRVVQLEAELEKAEQRLELERQSAHELMAANLRAVEMREREFKDSVSKRDAELKQAFAALSGEALSKASQELVRQADQKFSAQQQASAAELDKRREAVAQMVKPIAETLAKTDARLEQFGKEWAEDKGKLGAELLRLGQAGESLRGETMKLVRALREPHVRGAYGQMQLKRVAELAGMAGNCDFTEQDQTVDLEGRPLRPDMVVRLPAGRCLIVDAKANIKAYLEAVEATTPEEQGAKLDQFARHVCDQAVALAKKKYYAQYDGSPEFVVMFVPGDQFLDAALSREPELLETAARHQVILASPSTLIGMLRAVAVAFREQKLADDAVALRELGRELHERARVAFEHAAGLGEAIQESVELYNKLVNSIDSRILPTLRKFEEAGVKGAKDVPELPEVVVRVRGTIEGRVDEAKEAKAG